LRAAATMATRLDLYSATGTDRMPLQACNITHNNYVTVNVTLQVSVACCRHGLVLFKRNGQDAAAGMLHDM
jgi:hypothetical protein